MGHRLGKDEKLITKLRSMKLGEELEITRDQARTLVNNLTQHSYYSYLVGLKLIDNMECEIIGRRVVVREE